MLGFSTYAALLPELRDEWRCPTSQAGIVGGMFFAGYVATVSFWTALTDRVDARKVYLAGSVLAAAGSAGFGLAASAASPARCCSRCCSASASPRPTCRGCACSRIASPARTRAATSPSTPPSSASAPRCRSPSRASSRRATAGARPSSSARSGRCSPARWCSLLHRAGAAARRRRALAAALFPLARLATGACATARAPATPSATRRIASSSSARARWMVAFLAFSASLQSGDGFPWPAAAIAAVVNLLAVPASIFGNEVALRIGRRRWILS